MNEDELALVHTTYQVAEAEYLRGHLEGEGFYVVLESEHIYGVYDELIGAAPITKIKVPVADIEDAKGIASYLIIHNAVQLEDADAEEVSDEAEAFEEQEHDSGWGRAARAAAAI